MPGAELEEMGRSRRHTIHFFQALERSGNNAVRLGSGCVWAGMVLPMVGRRLLTGSGFLGGDWNNTTSNAPVADRNNAANTNTNRNNNNGGRLAKTSLF